MGKSVIIVSFGTRDEEGKEELQDIENDLRKISPYPVFSAYSSHSILKERKDKEGIESLIEKHKDEELLIMPLLIQKGGEYEKILRYGYKTGSPLLGSNNDIRKIASILSDNLKKKDDMSYLLLAHGRDGGTIEEYEKLNATLRKDIKIMTLKGKRSYKDEEIETKNITLIPFLLTYAHHAKNEIKLEAAAFFREKGKKVDLFERGILSLSPSFSSLIEEHFKELLK